MERKNKNNNNKNKNNNKKRSKNNKSLKLCLGDYYIELYWCTVQTDPAKNVWTRAYLILERNQTVRRQEEGENSVYLFVFCMNLGEML